MSQSAKDYYSGFCRFKNLRGNMIGANKVASPCQIRLGVRGRQPRCVVVRGATQRGEFRQNQQDDGKMKHMVEDEEEKVSNIKKGMQAANDTWDKAKDTAGDLVEAAKDGLLKQADTARKAPSHMRGADEGKRLDDMARYKAAEIELDKGR